MSSIGLYAAVNQGVEKKAGKALQDATAQDPAAGDEEALIGLTGAKMMHALWAPVAILALSFLGSSLKPMESTKELLSRLTFLIVACIMAWLAALIHD